VVRVILDNEQETAKYSSATFLDNSGIETMIDKKHAIAHNKVIIFDGETVITGSFNFTKQAENGNAENLLVIHSQELAKVYAANWQKHFEHAERYERKAEK
jgi:phosphatidylserine/phosphatidylglycerophosphate/cardiolipin synthase-like enzyme